VSKLRENKTSRESRVWGGERGLPEGIPPRGLLSGVVRSWGGGSRKDVRGRGLGGELKEKNRAVCLNKNFKRHLILSEPKIDRIQRSELIFGKRIVRYGKKKDPGGVSEGEGKKLSSRGEQELVA